MSMVSLCVPRGPARAIWTWTEYNVVPRAKGESRGNAGGAGVVATGTIRVRHR